MLDQWRIDGLSGFRKQQRQAKITINWTRSDEEKGLVTENPPVFASVVVLGRSDQKPTASSHVVDASGEWTFAVDANPSLGDGAILTCEFGIAWKGPAAAGSQQGTISTAAVFNDGEVLPLASWFVEGRGQAWRLTAMCEIVLSDGTPTREARLRHHGGKILVCADEEPNQSPRLRKLTEAGDRKLFLATLSKEDFLIIANLPSMSELPPDPFSEEPANTLQAGSPDLSLAVIPEYLRGVIAGSLIDMRSWLKNSGVKMGADDFAAYDPLAERLFASIKEEHLVDMIEQLLHPGCMLRSHNIECAAWICDVADPNTALAKMSLLSQSGKKSLIDLKGKDDDLIASFEAESAAGDEPEFRYDFRCHLQQPKFDWRSASALRLPDGVPVLIDAAKLPEGQILKQGFRATTWTSPSPISN
ncbi:MAG: hypothetical protein H7Y43_07335 [Akkermansiaceae bacterium]|nr:hypothetical protein [Verrucomicrobiales bacterium]